MPGLLTVNNPITNPTEHRRRLEARRELEKAMTKQTKTPLFLVRLNDGSYVGSPTHVRTVNPNLAAVFHEDVEAQAAKHGGRAVPIGDVIPSRRSLAPTTLPAVARRRKVAAAVPTVAAAETTQPPEPKAKAKPEKKKPAAKEPKAPRGLDRAEVVAMLKAAGFRLTQKSSDHWHGGDVKAARVVLPRAGSVTRLFVYKLPDAKKLVGWKSPEERKKEGLGAVTHVADVTTMAEVQRIVDAVVAELGLTAAPKATRKAKAKVTKAPAVEGAAAGTAQDVVAS